MLEQNGVSAVVAVGSNMGRTPSVIERALVDIADLPKSRLQHIGHWYRSQPVGGPKDQNSYTNGALLLTTALAPLALLKHLHAIEDKHHRTRTVKDGPRTLDLDLIDYGGIAVTDNAITLPHPRATDRAFVLLPINDFDPDYSLYEKPVSHWLADLNSTLISQCTRLSSLHG